MIILFTGIDSLGALAEFFPVNTVPVEVTQVSVKSIHAMTGDPIVRDVTRVITCVTTPEQMVALTETLGTSVERATREMWLTETEEPVNYCFDVLGTLWK
jgi:hypothetical protein